MGTATDFEGHQRGNPQPLRLNPAAVWRQRIRYVLEVTFIGFENMQSMEVLVTAQKSEQSARVTGAAEAFENRLRNKNESSQLQKNINRGGWFELGVSHDARRAGTDGDAACQEDCAEEDEQQQLIHTAGSARFASGHRWHVGVNLPACGSAERTAQPQCWASGQLPDPPADRSPRRAEPITHERTVHSRSRRTNARQHPTHQRAVNPRPGWAEAGWRSSD